ncbi:hypothetical protein QWZ13_02185 [Reinekea marina]|uniref:hypothetical protein n=1 Tax=Reinekea marina TaxID=1310421 RepID=UPI0025B60F5F|nr:hypothetical protein [Reinekea marina]MDN3647716.1 hypothetical protein [Reinekea marina]
MIRATFFKYCISCFCLAALKTWLNCHQFCFIALSYNATFASFNNGKNDHRNKDIPPVKF